MRIFILLIIVSYSFSSCKVYKSIGEYDSPGDLQNKIISGKTYKLKLTSPNTFGLTANDNVYLSVTKVDTAKVYGTYSVQENRKKWKRTTHGKLIRYNYEDTFDGLQANTISINQSKVSVGKTVFLFAGITIPLFYFSIGLSLEGQEWW
jgi:hypothetical protein